MIKRYRLINTLGLCLLLLSTASMVNAHQGLTHEAPWESCEDVTKDTKCSFTNGDGDLYKGTCQLFTDTLMCVRNEPIVYAVDQPASKVTALENDHKHDNDETDHKHEHEETEHDHEESHSH